MNIAIIIGVSEYEDNTNNLPGCKKDADMVNTLISKTGKFESILYINENFSSAIVKEKITEFVTENKTNKIDELFFYFTGHGEFYSEEFYYILSDYNKNKKKQTSLQNEEIDSLIKTLSPDLVVKVIDACQSGKSYIKKPSVVAKYFKETQDKFNNCYFLNSSLKDQSSMQSDIISDFTLSFIKAVKEHKSKDIRYKDIIDFISDEFESNELQTPFFVVQADYTEKFCEINDTIKEYLNQIDTILSETGGKGDDVESVSLVEKIKNQASEYLNKEQVLQVITELKTEIEKIKCRNELNEVYDLEIIFSENYDDIIDTNVIGDWLDKNSHEFFAKSITKRVRTYRDNANSAFMRTQEMLGLGTNVEYKYIKDGFDIEIEVPYKTIIFNLNTKFPNIESYTSRIVFLISKRKIRFFYFITNFETKNWDDRELNNNIDWYFSEHLINNKKEVKNGVMNIYDIFEKRVKKYLEDKFEDIE